MNNSQRFLDAYNTADRALRSRFGLKPSMTFADAVRRAAAINAVVRRFEDDLIDFGRLRNAIVHKSSSAMTIAEPHDDVTERLEHIAAILSSPPLASSISHAAETLDAGVTVREAVERMTKKGFSNMPVISRGAIVGVFTNKSAVEFVANNVGNVDAAMAATPVERAVSQDSYYAVMGDCPVDEILDAFEKNRKLAMIILTKSGLTTGAILGVITTGDLATVSKMLDSYRI